MKSRRLAEKIQIPKNINPLLFWRRTKIIATLGPASNKTATIERQPSSRLQKKVWTVTLTTTRIRTPAAAV